MPPRHTYWTILFGNQPTAFRSAEREELLPTFKQIQAKHPDAVMMWFARGRLWKSPEEARETFDRPRFDRPRGPKPQWQNRGPNTRDERPRDPRGPKPEWRDRPQGDRPRGPRPEWRDRPQGGDRPKPPASARWPNKGSYSGGAPPASPKSRRDEGAKPRSGEGGSWREKPRGDRPPRPQGDVPPGERPPFKGPDKRGRDWRPGGAHKDPRDRFKVPRDVKRARFKQNLERERTNPRPPYKKKKDEE